MTNDKLPRTPSAPLAACGAILAALALVGLAYGYDRSQGPPPEEPVAHGPAEAGSADAGTGDASAGNAGTGNVARLLDGQPLDLNRASAEELELLPRIGPTLARRIIEDRERRGPFRSVSDLTRVRGIGPRTLEGILPLASASVTEP